MSDRSKRPGLDRLLAEHRNAILRISASHGAENVRVFGSMARGDDRPDSDLDLLVVFQSGRTLIDHSGLILDLQDLLGRKVDVTSERALHWYIRDQVLQEAVAI
jgi:predicted nucleotidyltransferase